LYVFRQAGPLELTDRDSEPVIATDMVDHGLSYSVYFTDPDGD
jgi:catechol-2,3-dioxygenase